MQKNSYNWRQQFLEDLASEESARTGVNAAAIIRCIKNSEADRKIYSTMKKYLKGDNAIGLNYIET
eukprot:8468590-Ditylum_brightwellii.AAC.1